MYSSNMPLCSKCRSDLATSTGPSLLIQIWSERLIKLLDLASTRETSAHASYTFQAASDYIFEQFAAALPVRPALELSWLRHLPFRSSSFLLALCLQSRIRHGGIAVFRMVHESLLRAASTGRYY